MVSHLTRSTIHSRVMTCLSGASGEFFRRPITFLLFVVPHESFLALHEEAPVLRTTNVTPTVGFVFQKAFESFWTNGGCVFRGWFRRRDSLGRRLAFRRRLFQADFRLDAPVKLLWACEVISDSVHTLNEAPAVFGVSHGSTEVFSTIECRMHVKKQSSQSFRCHLGTIFTLAFI